MQRLKRVGLLVFAMLAIGGGHADAWIRSPANNFATLPSGSGGPEGITADSAGNVYVTSFGFNATGELPGPGQIFVFDDRGDLLRQLSVLIPGAPATPSTSHLIGLAFHPTTGDLLVIDFGAGQVLKVDPVTGAASVFTTITGTPTPGLNALAFDSAGNVYISDSFGGTIWRTGPQGGTATVWVTHALLTTTGTPPFGANGIAFNNSETTLFVANTGSDTIVKIPASGTPLTAGTPQVFVNSINGADGLIVDAQDNIWVAANQADEIVVLAPNGRVIAKLGDFKGINSNGAPIGLLFPASLVFSGEFLYVTNLALDLRLVNPALVAVDSPWAAQVTSYTVSRIRARIPPIPGLP